MPRPFGSPKFGGRKKGGKNRVTLQREKEIAASGLTPLQYMLSVMRAPLPPELKERIENEELSADMIGAINQWHDKRLDAAKSAAPFVHPRLTAITTKDGEDIKPQDVDYVEMARHVAFLFAQSAQADNESTVKH